MKRTFNTALTTLSLGFLFLFSFQYLAAWTEPTVAPPDGNVSANAGIFSTTGGITSNSSGDYTVDDFAFGSPTLDYDNDLTHSIRMLFDKSNGSFRVGRANSTYWDNASRGSRSFAAGWNARATNSYAASFGGGSLASGYASFAAGYYPYAAGRGSFAVGEQTDALGDASNALGYYTEANADYSTAVGKYIQNDTANSFMVGFKSAVPTVQTTDPGLFVDSNNNVGIKTSSITAGLALDVEGSIGAIQYCDENGANCFISSDVSGGGGSSAFFGGDGSDGILNISSGVTTLDLGGNGVFIKNYTSISITGTGQLKFSNPHSNGTLIKLKSQGNITITSSANPTIDASGMGSTAMGISAAASPTGGSTGNSSVRGVGGTTGTTFLNIAGKSVPFSAGGGGAGGGGSFFGGTPGSGGRGGAGLLIECGGALNFGATSRINMNGANGAAGSSNLVGSGGGGGGGTAVLLYNTLVSNNGIITSFGGNGGSGSSGGSGILGGGKTGTGGYGGRSSHPDYGGGGAGGGGAAGGNNGNNGADSGGGGGTGGGGGGGAWLVAKNTEF